MKYDIERSLLQKAVRRGDEEQVGRIVKYLVGVEDEAWLKKRLFVIAYEECWPLGSSITLTNLTEEYRKIARSVKNKNAAGLVSLATKYNEGSKDIIRSISSEALDNVVSIAEAIKSPGSYWKFIEQQPGYLRNWNRIEAARKAVSKAGFVHDKALMYAAACLALEEEIPSVSLADPIPLPYWIAFDKHTEMGRSIITEASNNIGVDAYAGMQMAFLFEGSLCNQISDSPYWDLYVNWKINKLGVAVNNWDELKAEIIRLSEDRAQSLYNKINADEELTQLSLF